MGVFNANQPPVFMSSSINCDQSYCEWGRGSTGAGVLVAVGVALLALSAPAQALCSRGPYGRAEFQISAPVQLRSRDVAIGHALTPWLDAQRTYSVDDFTCAKSDVVELGVEGAVGSGDVYSEAGVTYTLYSGGIEGVAMAVRSRPISHAGQGGGFQSGHEQVLLSGTGYSTPFITGVQVKFVKTAATVAGGTLPRTNVGATYVRWGATGWHSMPVWINAVDIVAVDQPICRGDSQTVDMGEIPLSRFSGPGSGTLPRRYTVTLVCEAGVGQVNYQLASLTRVLDEAEGIAEVSGGAAGIGIQFLDGDGSPLAFYRNHDFGDAGSDVRKHDFLARYLQVDATVTPGEANAGLTLVLSYP